MPRANANGIELEYDSFGSPSDPALLLVMGLGAQMILWDEEFCGALASRGHHVIRYDNRDIGLSTKLEGRPCATPIEAMQAQLAGKPFQSAYTLAEMADDAAGLLDALGIASADVVGASMGGMIVQTIALRHPERVRSMTSIMSTTGARDLPPAKPEAMQILMTPAPADRAGNIERAVVSSRVIGSPGFPFDEQRVRERAARAYDRCFYPEGMARQLVAVLASGSRRDALRAVRAPSLVIHGKADPLVPVEGGIDTAKSIPGAELLLVEGMGHDLPVGAWPQLVGAISGHASKSLR
jgi:pimeloyl-ACP methyl ester carboxylesterase